MKKIKLSIAFILLLLVSIPCFCSNNDFKESIEEYPEYLEGTNLIPILRGRNFNLYKGRGYEPRHHYWKEGEERIKEEIIDNEIYNIQNNTYYFTKTTDYKHRHYDEPNFARARSVIQTIKQRCKKEKRKLTIKEKNVLKKIKSMQHDIEEFDSLYRQDIEAAAEEARKKRNKEQIIIILFSAIFSMFFIYFIYIIDKKANKKEEEKQKKKKIKEDFLNLFNSKNYIAAAHLIEDFYLYGAFFDNEKVAYCYCMAGKYQEAIDIYNRLLQTKPNDNEVKFNLALAKYKLNSADSKYLEELYNKEKPFVILKEDMKIMFNDEEQKEAKQIKKDWNDRIIQPYKIGNIFGTYKKYN